LLMCCDSRVWSSSQLNTLSNRGGDDAVYSACWLYMDCCPSYGVDTRSARRATKPAVPTGAI
jgi:hypothetical protein